MSRQKTAIIFTIEKVFIHRNKNTIKLSDIYVSFV